MPVESPPAPADYSGGAGPRPPPQRRRGSARSSDSSDDGDEAARVAALSPPARPAAAACGAGGACGELPQLPGASGGMAARSDGGCDAAAELCLQSMPPSVDHGCVQPIGPVDDGLYGDVGGLYDACERHGESPATSPVAGRSPVGKRVRIAAAAAGGGGPRRGASTAAAKEEKEPRKKKRRRRGKVIINTTFCRYDLIRRFATENDWVEDRDEEGEAGLFNVFWTDTSVNIHRVMRLQNFQRINHFPAMHLIARKIQLALTLGKMRKVFPQHYAFAPRTWSLKSERNQFRKYVAALSGKKTFIVKPSAGCQGKGIFLTQDPLDIEDDVEDAVIQEYVAKPLLIEGKKFDLRVYALVTSIRHPSVFIYNDGLVRLCTLDYVKPAEQNLESTQMHLTNYAINKTSEDFVFNEDEDSGDKGHKRDFHFLNAYLREQGHDVDRMWGRIDGVIVKTLLSALPQLQHVYNSCLPHNNDGYTCFEILGFDLLLDQNLKPWLLEVNHSPSFHCDTPLDDRIKSGVIGEAIRILNVQQEDRVRDREREREEFRRRMDAQMRRSLAKKAGEDGEGERRALERERHDLEEQERKRVEALVAAKRREEDGFLQNYRRVMPTADPERAALFEQFVEAAREANIPQTTQATTQREAEGRREREKQRERQAEEAALRRGLGRPQAPDPAPPPPAGAGFFGGHPAARPAERPLARAASDPTGGASDRARGAARDYDRDPDQGRREGAAGARSGDEGKAALRREKSEVQGRPRAATLGERGLLECRTGSARRPPQGADAGGDGGAGGDASDAARMRRQVRLEQQMERHKHRIALGPRLSVFQLRDQYLTVPSGPARPGDRVAVSGPPAALLAQQAAAQVAQQAAAQPFGTTAQPLAPAAAPAPAPAGATGYTHTVPTAAAASPPIPAAAPPVPAAHVSGEQWPPGHAAAPAGRQPLPVAYVMASGAPAPRPAAAPGAQHPSSALPARPHGAHGSRHRGPNGQYTDAASRPLPQQSPPDQPAAPPAERRARASVSQDP